MAAPKNLPPMTAEQQRAWRDHMDAGHDAAWQRSGGNYNKTYASHMAAHQAAFMTQHGFAAHADALHKSAAKYAKAAGKAGERDHAPHLAGSGPGIHRDNLGRFS